MKSKQCHCPNRSDRLRGGPVIRSGQRCLALSIWAVMVVSLTADAQDVPTRYLTDLGDPPISEIIGYLPINERLAIAADYNGGLYLIESDRRTRKINASGAGPCENRQVSSFTVVGDTVFVLDKWSSRITGYLISSGRCVSEITHEELYNYSSVTRMGGWFYVVRTRYNNGMPSEEPLLFRIGDAETLEPLALTIADLDADLLMTHVQLGPEFAQTRVRNGLMYFLLPLSQRVWRFNPTTEEVTYISLSNRSPDISEHSESIDYSRMGDAIFSSEHELDLFLLEEQLAVLSYFENRMWIGLYSYAGDLIAKGPVDRLVQFAEADALYDLVPTGMEDNFYEIRPVPLPDP